MSANAFIYLVSLSTFLCRAATVPCSSEHCEIVPRNLTTLLRVQLFGGEACMLMLSALLFTVSALSSKSVRFSCKESFANVLGKVGAINSPSVVICLVVFYRILC